jgi:hypothetical protein
VHQTIADFIYCKVLNLISKLCCGGGGGWMLDIFKLGISYKCPHYICTVGCVLNITFLPLQWRAKVFWRKKDNLHFTVYMYRTVYFSRSIRNQWLVINVSSLMLCWASQPGFETHPTLIKIQQGFLPLLTRFFSTRCSYYLSYGLLFYFPNKLDISILQ